MRVYYKSIDALKGIAIIGVVLIHSGAANLNGIYGRLGSFGARGVQLFFIISAFFMFISIDKISNSDYKRSIGKWYLKKFIRLIPLFYFFNIIALIFMYINGSFGSLSGLNILCNFLFISGFNPYYINAININWYIADLAIFIILAPWLKKWFSNFERALIGALISGVVTIYLSQILDKIWNTSDEMVEVAFCYVFAFWIELPCLFLGLLLYYIIKSNIIEQVKCKKILSITLVLFSIYILIKGLAIDCSFIGLSEIFVFSVLSFIVILAQMIYFIPLLRFKPIQYLGKYSYGIYLSHNIFIKYVRTFIEKYFDRMSIQVILTAMITLFISLMISILCTKLIEQPVTKLIYSKTNL